MSSGHDKNLSSHGRLYCRFSCKGKIAPLLLLTTINYLFFCTIARKNKIRMASVIEEVTTEP